MNLMMLLEMAAGAFGERVAFQNGADQLTYQQLFDAAGALAADLSDGRTKHLAMLDESSLALPVAVFGASWAGVPFAPAELSPDGSRARFAREPAPAGTPGDRARPARAAR